MSQLSKRWTFEIFSLIYGLNLVQLYRENLKRFTLLTISNTIPKGSQLRT
jgi:hypothetical protein